MERELFRYVYAARALLFITVAIGVGCAAVTIVQMALLSRVVARVFLGHQNLQRVGPLLVVLLGIILLRALLVFLREVTAQRSAIRVTSQLRERLCRHLLRLGPAYSRDERTGELAATAVEGIERLDAYVSRYLPQIALSVLVPLLIAAYILPLDWASAVLLLVTGPVIPLLMILVGSYTKDHVDRQWSELSRLSAHFLDAVQGLPTLVAFGRALAEQGRVAAISEAFRVKTMKVLRLAFLSGMVLELMVALAIGLVAATLGIRLLDGGISFEHAFLVLLLAPEFYRPLRELGVHHHAGMEGKAVAARIVQILQTPAPAATPTAAVERPAGALAIELRDVTYTYPGAARPAIDGVTLTLPPGARTALMGHSGAGKSTLANLLLRFVDAQAGAVTVNGLPLAGLPVDTWREYVALVPQRPYLFYASVRENIRLARPGATDEEVARAAELAGAATFIARLPRGYDTPVGERGAGLSAGQGQRLAIARAFLKDAPLLILDEPTSSLDPESEALVAQALELLMRDRTVLIVAHRRATIAHAEQVAVLDHGKLVEVGPYDALLRGDGPLARLMGRRREEPVAL